MNAPPPALCGHTAARRAPPLVLVVVYRSPFLKTNLILGRKRVFTHFTRPSKKPGGGLKTDFHSLVSHDFSFYFYLKSPRTNYRLNLKSKFN